MKKEAARLALFEGELAKLKQKEAADVADLRYQLEEADRDLVWLERDFKTKEAAYVKAKEAFETAAGRKREIKESMTLLVLSSERRKEEKLNELMAMDADSSDESGARVGKCWRVSVFLTIYDPTVTVLGLVAHHQIHLRVLVCHARSKA